MSEVCLFPTCQRHPEKNGYCIGHRIYAGTTFEKEKPASIAKRSEKMKENIKDLKKIYAELLSLPENKYCQLQLPGCTKIATVVHHTKGREGKQLKNQDDMMVSCSNCNITAEQNDAEAREKGIKKSKHDKNYKRSKL